jgi:predicted HD superfamily hydrolase involved in NAD metabolism
VIDEKELAARLKGALKRSRFEHTQGVVKAATQLARWHRLPLERLRLAAWLHDCGKALEREEMLPLLKKAGADKHEKALPALWHAPVGAWLAQHEYGVRDREVLQAIRFHSTGAPEQTPLQMALFVADYTEPGRPPWPELPILRRLARTDLRGAWAHGIKHKLVDLLERERPLHPRSLAAYHNAFHDPA